MYELVKDDQVQRHNPKMKPYMLSRDRCLVVFKHI